MNEPSRRRAAPLLAAISLAAAAPGVANAGDVQTRASNVELRHVAIELRLDWAARQAVATTTLTLAPRRAADHLLLDAAQLRIESVRSGDGRELAFQYDGSARDDALRIELGHRAAAGEPMQIGIAYRTGWVNAIDPANLAGSNGRGLRFLQPTSSEPTRRRQVWASGELGSARYWYPGIDHPSALRTSELRVSVPAPLMVVAGGRLQGVQHHADGTRSYHWRTEAPEQSHRTVFVAGEFTPIPQHHRSVTLNNFGYPDEAAGVAASVVMHADALGFFERLIGQPFPHPAHTQVFVQELPWNTPGTALSVQTENMVDDLGTHEDFQYLWDGLQSESLVQQWFGGSIRWCDARHVWLEKAFAHHLAALYTEHRHGRDEYLLWYVAANQATALADLRQPGADAALPVLPGRALSADELAAFAGGNTPYFRGATVLHGLRELLGAERWQRVMRRFAAAHSGKAACTSDLRRAAEAEAGRDLGWFFAQWLERSAVPVFEVSSRWQAGHLELLVSQVQSSAAGATSPPYFEGPIEVQIDHRVRRVVLKPQAENRFRFALAAAPRLVHLDPQSAWLKELRHAKSDAELLHQLRHAHAAPVRQWAAAELVKRVQAKDAPAGLREAMIAALRELIGSRQLYWRVRFQALGTLATLLAPADPRQPALIDEATTALLLQVIRDEGRWLRTAALRALGLAREPRHAELYRSHLGDDSDRVVNAAAIALGRSGSAIAFDALAALPAKPSWKNQSLISALAGLAELRDPRGRELALKAFADMHSARWTLATPVWDFRLAAADTLVALAHTEPATAIALERFDRALADGELHDIFATVQLLAVLGDAAAERVFPALRERFAGDANALQAVQAHEARWKARRGGA